MQIENWNRKEKKAFFEKIKESYGFNDKLTEELINNQYFSIGKDKMRRFSGNLDLKNFIGINKQLNVQNIGIYFATTEQGFLRLSFDFLTIYGKHATKNIIVLDEEQREAWIEGYEIKLTEEQNKKISGNCIIVQDLKGDILGSGFLKNEMLLNYLPKEIRNSI